jgi:hypothetical protein
MSSLKRKGTEGPKAERPLLKDKEIVIDVEEPAPKKRNGRGVYAVKKNIFIRYKYINHFLVDKINWKDLAKNPVVTDILRQFMEKTKKQDNYFWHCLSSNPEAIDILRENPTKIYWKEVAGNPKMYDFLMEHFFKLTERQKNRNFWSQLSKNHRAIDLLRQHPDKINWANVSMNEGALELLLDNTEKIDWFKLAFNKNLADFFEKLRQRAEGSTVKTISDLSGEELNVVVGIRKKIIKSEFWKNVSMNENAIKILEENMDKIHWMSLATNHKAGRLFIGNEEKIFWNYFSMNTSPEAISLLEANPDKIYYGPLCGNKNAIRLIEKKLESRQPRTYTSNPHNDINWGMLSANVNAERVLSKYPSKIDWNVLSANPGCIRLLESNEQKLDLNSLCINPNAIHLIFSLDTRWMREQYKEFRQELEKYVSCENRKARMSILYGSENE